MKNLSEFLPWIPELFRDIAAMLPRAEEQGAAAHTEPRGYAWLFGERRVDVARALCAPSAHTPNVVLIGEKREELFTEKNELSAECMGFLRDIRRPNWSSGLPSPVRAVSASFCISSLSVHETQEFLQEACRSLRMGGVFFWSDFFLPQSLSLLTLYQREHAGYIKNSEAKHANAAENGKPPPHSASSTEVFDTLLRERNLMLLENAIRTVTENGFGNVEIVAKRMNLAVIAAYR